MFPCVVSPPFHHVGAVWGENGFSTADISSPDQHCLMQKIHNIVGEGGALIMNEYLSHLSVNDRGAWWH